MRAYRVRFHGGVAMVRRTSWYYRSRIAAEKAAFYLGRLGAKVEPIQPVNVRTASLRG